MPSGTCSQKKNKHSVVVLVAVGKVENKQTVHFVVAVRGRMGEKGVTKDEVVSGGVVEFLDKGCKSHCYY